MDQLRKIDNCGYFVRNKNLQQLSALFTWEKSGFLFFSVKWKEGLHLSS